MDICPKSSCSHLQILEAVLEEIVLELGAECCTGGRSGFQLIDEGSTVRTHVVHHWLNLTE
jgi:hypothetical protein